MRTPPLHRSQPRSLNLGILAHVDAGKTTLTERLLHLAGVIDEPGSVDSGTTRTDSLALERRRGITIKAAVVSFPLGGTTVNVVDTPGHPDFIAEVERAIGVLDGAVVVLSAVEGVQPQTRILVRALQRQRLPTLFFVNKVDRTGADLDGVLAAMRRRLTPDLLPMGCVDRAGSRAASFRASRPDDLEFRERETAVLAEHDDDLLAAYVEGRVPAPDRLRARVAAQTRAGLLHPVFAGSAMTGAGVPELMAGIRTFLPATAPDRSGPPSGRVFKVERGAAGEKVAYVRMFSGAVGVRGALAFADDRRGKVAGVELFDRGDWVRADAVAAGQIGRLHGLGAVRVGDGFGPAASAAGHHFAPPTLEASVTPVRREEGPALRRALEQLADQDPLIDVHVGSDGRPTVSLYGRVQQEVLGATLAEEHGIEVEFADASVLHVERPRRVGSAVERLNTASNPYHATLGLRVAPGPAGSGLTFAVEAPAYDMPLYLFHGAEAFANAIESHVRRALERGRHGWQVTDCVVTVTECGYSTADGPPSRRGPLSTSLDWRRLTPLVLHQAIARAGTVVCEPVLEVLLEVPTASAAAVHRVVARWGAEPVSQTGEGDLARLVVRLRAARLHDLQRRLPDLTGGEGVLESTFDSYRPVLGRPPERSRAALQGVQVLPHIGLEGDVRA